MRSSVAILPIRRSPQSCLVCQPTPSTLCSQIGGSSARLVAAAAAALLKNELPRSQAVGPGAGPALLVAVRNVEAHGPGAQAAVAALCRLVCVPYMLQRAAEVERNVAGSTERSVELATRPTLQLAKLFSRGELQALLESVRAAAVAAAEASGLVGSAPEAGGGGADGAENME